MSAPEPTHEPPGGAPLPTTTQVGPAAPGSGRRGPVLIAGGLLAAGFLTVLVVRARSGPAPAEAAAAATTLRPPEEDGEVVLSSVPPGAEVLRDGVLVGETPESLRLPGGQAVDVVLRKPGYADKAVRVDPAKGHKLVVKLDLHAGLASAVRPAAAPPAATPHAASHPAAAPPAPAAPPVAVAAKPVAAAAPLGPARPVAAAARPAAAPLAAPAPPPKPLDTLVASMDRLAASSVPGAHRVGTPYVGAGEEGEHGDWNANLTQGRCYEIVAKGGRGVERIYLYLWGPNGSRATDRREGEPDVVLHYCAAASGTYHIQAKVAEGEGSYRAAVYAR